MTITEKIDSLSREAASVASEISTKASILASYLASIGVDDEKVTDLIVAIRGEARKIGS